MTVMGILAIKISNRHGIGPMEPIAWPIIPFAKALSDSFLAALPAPAKDGGAAFA
jgi:hypothetical protein